MTASILLKDFSNLSKSTLLGLALKASKFFRMSRTMSDGESQPVMTTVAKLISKVARNLKCKRREDVVITTESELNSFLHGKPANRKAPSSRRLPLPYRGSDSQRGSRFRVMHWKPGRAELGRTYGCGQNLLCQRTGRIPRLRSTRYHQPHIYAHPRIPQRPPAAYPHGPLPIGIRF